jgi:hypothetical protein
MRLATAVLCLVVAPVLGVGGAGLKDSKAKREELVEKLIEVGGVGARGRSLYRVFNEGSLFPEGEGDVVLHTGK